MRGERNERNECAHGTNETLTAAAGDDKKIPRVLAGWRVALLPPPPPPPPYEPPEPPPPTVYFGDEYPFPAGGKSNALNDNDKRKGGGGFGFGGFFDEDGFVAGTDFIHVACKAETLARVSFDFVPHCRYPTARVKRVPDSRINHACVLYVRLRTPRVNLN